MVRAEIVLWTCAAYVFAGLVIGVPFIWRGIDKVDAAANGASWSFRAVILPGCVALWPWILRLWLRGLRGNHL